MDFHPVVAFKGPSLCVSINPLYHLPDTPRFEELGIIPQVISTINSGSTTTNYEQPFPSHNSADYAALAGVLDDYLLSTNDQSGVGGCLLLDDMYSSNKGVAGSTTGAPPILEEQSSRQSLDAGALFRNILEDFLDKSQHGTDEFLISDPQREQRHETW